MSDYGNLLDEYNVALAYIEELEAALAPTKLAAMTRPPLLPPRVTTTGTTTSTGTTTAP